LAPTAPDALDATLRLTAAGDGGRPLQADLVGAVLGSQADAEKLLDQLVARAGADPAAATRRHLPYQAAKRYLAELGSVDDQGEQAASEQSPQQGHLFTKSEFFRQPLPSESITALVEHLAAGSAGGYSREVTFTPWGGAYNRVRADATAFVHRDELFIIQHLVTIDPGTPATARDAARGWLARSWALVHPWGSRGVYPNFPDPDLTDWARAYYGDNYDRLLRVKARYDPDNFFRFPQSLPTQ
jgi:FAD/FMN-containing dehydrogenase